MALSGLAKEIQPLIQADYLAGKWRRHLITQLPWEDIVPLGRLEKVVPYRAPSWSWASDDGPMVISMGGHLGGALAEVVDAVVVLAENDPMAAVIGGHLALKASTQPVQVVTVTERDSLVYRLRSLTDCDLGPKALVDSAFSSEEFEKAYFCVPIQQYKNNRAEIVIKGLLLESTGDDRYRRIGLFTDSLKALSENVRRRMEDNTQLVTII